ncbi:hypothetical protein BOTNAR_0045g00490 [Botryotinia narcissicola]|uniref:Uncharacterized protein n=1 Tax=Botryotinia narcissicola TaxID=278944 RepID=A0A4Z1J2B0_9HELO|nr:hypothetical protein BOTNAR_0045g00490 [Botryotinia narcissicola]
MSTRYTQYKTPSHIQKLGPINNSISVGHYANMNDTGLPGNETMVRLSVDSTIATNESIPQLSAESDHIDKVPDYCREAPGA